MANKTITVPARAASAIAADEVGGALFQRIKLAFGGEGVVSDVTSGTPLPVTLIGGGGGSSGPLEISNFPDTQQVAGTLAISNFPTTQPVSGTFWPATQPVSGTMSIDNFPVTQQVVGAVAISNFPATQAVTGTFWQATQPVSAVSLPLPTGAATETTLSGINAKLPALSGGRVPVELPASSIQVTSTALDQLADSLHQGDTPHTSGDFGQLMLAIRSDSDAPTANDGDYTILKMDEEGRLKVSTKPASYAAITGNITANGGTVFANVERFSNLMIHCTGTFSTVNVTFEGSLNSTNGTDGNWFTVQGARSNANTPETTTGNLSAAPAYAWELSVNALKWFRVRATAWTSGTQVWTMIPGTYATEPIPIAQVTATQPVSGTVTATNTTPTPLNTSSAATTNPVLVKGSAGTLFGIVASNVGAAVAYLKLYNKATAPSVGTDVPVLTIPIPAGGVIPLQFGTLGHRFALGIGIGITAGLADNDTAEVAAAQVKVLTTYV